MTDGPGAPAVIKRLHKDHINVLRLLNVLAHQSRMMAAGEAVNPDIVRGIITFYREYVAKSHHPIEDAIYETLNKSQPTIALAAHGILEDHRDCTRQLECLESALNVVVASKESKAQGSHNHHIVVGDEKVYSYFSQQAESFSGHERLHMINEEALLRLATTHFGKAEWEEIEKRLAGIKDQLFGAERATRFDRLREAIAAADANLRYHDEDGGHKEAPAPNESTS